MNRVQRTRRGFALIDVILALAIVALAVTGTIALLRQTMYSLRQANERDRAVRAAGVALASLVIRDRDWLDAHTGTTRYQVWTLDVGQLSPDLRTIALRDTATGFAWVETTLYHPSTPEPIAGQ